MNLNIYTSLLILLSCLFTCQKTPTKSTAVADQVAEQTNTEPVHQIPSSSPTPERETTLGSGWRLSSRPFKDVNHKFKYSIEGEYPQVDNSTDARALKLNREIKRSIAERYTYLTAPNTKDLREHIRIFPTEDPLETAEFDYEIISGTDELVSIRFQETTYSRGSAHPVQGFFTVNYDAESGQVIEIGDIFEPGYAYLQFLSQTCIRKLRVSGSWSDAVSPQRKNFRSWNISSEGIVINFDRCEVAACAEGTQTVIIPYSELKEHLNYNHAIFRLAAQEIDNSINPSADSIAFICKTLLL